MRTSLQWLQSCQSSHGQQTNTFTVAQYLRLYMFEYFSCPVFATIPMVPIWQAKRLFILYTSPSAHKCLATLIFLRRLILLFCRQACNSLAGTTASYFRQRSGQLQFGLDSVIGLPPPHQFLMWSVCLSRMGHLLMWCWILNNDTELNVKYVRWLKTFVSCLLANDKKHAFS